MKCPHCTKDISMNWLSAEVMLSEMQESLMFYRLLECQHCYRVIFYLYSGHTKSKLKKINDEIIKLRIFGSTPDGKKLLQSLEKSIVKAKKIFQYPFAKTVFNIEGIPEKVKDSLNEAERCFSIGARNGTVACLRKCIYLLCDNILKKDESIKYDEKIEKLFPNDNDLATLAKQIKWLGDNHLHGVNEEKYTDKSIEQAMNILPFIIKEIYEKRRRVKEVSNLLNQGLQKTKG